MIVGSLPHLVGILAVLAMSSILLVSLLLRSCLHSDTKLVQLDMSVHQVQTAVIFVV
jgi:hypothetical protein